VISKTLGLDLANKVTIDGLSATCLSLACLLVCFFFVVPAAHAESGFEVHEIGPGVWVHTGEIGDFAPGNKGDLANLSFVIGERCVAVIDTGGSRWVGESLLGAIRSKTKLPICYVIATHMHPDHLLGHAAFLDEHPQFVAAATQARALSIRREGYLSRQKATLGENLARGTEVVLPNHPVIETEQLDLGGRMLTVRSWRTAHTDNDLTVQDSQTHTLFTGDLLFVDHLPVIDGSIKGWLAILPELGALAHEDEKSVPVVPGHGPDTGKRDKELQRPKVLVANGTGSEIGQTNDKSVIYFAAETDYLSSVAKEVRVALKAQQTLQQTVSASTLPARWKLVELYHRRNITAAYAELEWED
jgi:quinoprotein relay system zinc metallohydrolase 2